MAENSVSRKKIEQAYKKANAMAVKYRRGPEPFGEDWHYWNGRAEALQELLNGR